MLFRVLHYITLSLNIKKPTILLFMQTLEKHYRNVLFYHCANVTFEYSVVSNYV